MSARRVTLLRRLLLLVLLGPLSGTAATAPSAEDLVRETTTEVLSVLRAERGASVPGEAKINALVEEKVLPHFDFERMTRLAAGRSWTTLEEVQRRALVTEFRTLLVRTYSVALRSYQDQTIDYPAAPPRRDPAEAVVRTRVSQRGAKSISMDYRLNLQPSGWKVYDILVDGISLVVNYRSLFNSTIESSGADGLIDLLREKNAAGAPGDAPA